MRSEGGARVVAGPTWALALGRAYLRTTAAAIVYATSNAPVAPGIDPPT